MTERTLNTILTLSAVPVSDEQSDQVVSVIEHELEAIDQGASPERLIDYVWGDRDPVQYSRVGGRRLVDQITESELRLLDGNR